jgi:hypothetical protein
MAVESMTNPRTALPNAYNDVTAREVDFVTRFADNWEALRNILGIMRPIRKAPGTQLISYTADVALESGDVDPGNVIPYSKTTISQAAKGDLEIKKYAKAVPIEEVNKYGAAIAVQKTDDALLNEIQGEILDEFYAFALTGSLKDNYDSFQMAVAMAVAKTKDKFKKMRLNYGQIVVFANTLDVGKYQGAANITVQTKAGIEYVKDFTGVDTMIVSSEIPEGTVVAIPVDNIVMYYIDPSDGDFAALGLEYTTGNDATNLIGVHKEGVYERVSGDTHTLSGIALWAEYLDAVAVITFGGA